jgi:serine/threonine protein kinase
MQSVSIDQLIGKDAGGYHIDRLLGEGPVSSFCEAHHASGRRVILTLFKLPAMFSPQAHARFLARFQQVGAALVQLKHPVILPVYEYGECMGYPYLATPFVPGSSLVQVLQTYGRIPSEPVLELLKQVAEGLDYASSNGVMHGALSPANILAGKNRGEVQVAGFGLARILALQGLESQDAVDAHLLNIAGSYLALPTYTAPEIVQGAPYSASADIYALGILLFELLSGKPPFSGETPFEVLHQYSHQSVLSLSALVPTLPAGVDAVIQKALAPLPEMRFQSASEFIYAFEQALQVQQAASQPLASIAQNTANTPEKTDVTGPLTIDWQAVKDATARRQADEFAGREQMTPEETRARMAQQATLPGLDPFAWWSNVSATQTVSHPQVNKSTPGAARKAGGRKQRRRQVVALLSVSSVVVAGLGGGGIAFAHYWQQREQALQAASATPTPSPTMPPTPTPTPSPTPQPTVKSKATSRPSTTPTPTAPPAPTPTPTPGHTGTVIASTSMAPNSAVKFNGGDDILIHLASGGFVAYNRACTHAQVPVNYEPGSQQLVCPAHGARFAASNGSVLQGPAHKPLPAVPIHVNGDGTITV